MSIVELRLDIAATLNTINNAFLSINISLSLLSFAYGLDVSYLLSDSCFSLLSLAFVLAEVNRYYEKDREQRLSEDGIEFLDN